MQHVVTGHSLNTPSKVRSWTVYPSFNPSFAGMNPWDFWCPSLLSLSIARPKEVSRLTVPGKWISSSICCVIHCHLRLCETANQSVKKAIVKSNLTLSSLRINHESCNVTQFCVHAVYVVTIQLEPSFEENTHVVWASFSKCFKILKIEFKKG